MPRVPKLVPPEEQPCLCVSKKFQSERPNLSRELKPVEVSSRLTVHCGSKTEKSLSDGRTDEGTAAAAAAARPESKSALLPRCLPAAAATCGIGLQASAIGKTSVRS